MIPHRILRAATLVATVLALACGAPVDEPATGIAITSAAIAFVNVNVVPMDQERVLEAQTVIVEDGVITGLGPADAIEVPAGALRIDGTDKYLMPGLVDSNVHARLEDHLRLYVANGITSVRNRRGGPQQLEWRQRVVEDPEFVSPTIYTAGTLIDGPTGQSGSAVATTPEEGRSLVSAHAAAGYEFIEVHDRLSADTYDAILEAAVAQGLTVQGHVPNTIGLFRALASGQHAIEQFSGYQRVTYSTAFALDFGSGIAARRARRVEIAEGLASGELEWDDVFDPTAVDRAVEATLEAGTWSIPAVVVNQMVAPDEYQERANAPGIEYLTPETLDDWNPSNNRFTRGVSSDQRRALRALQQGFDRRMITALYEAGGNLLVGTDTPSPFVLPGFSIHEELANFVAAGLSPYETLARATRIPADFMGLADSVGIIAPQRRADLLLLDADPLADVANVRLLAGVSLRGTWLSATTIDAMLEEIEVIPSALSEEVTFRSGPLTLHGYLWKPAGPGPFPVVLWNHQSWPTPFLLTRLGELFTERGYVLFQPHRRGFGSSGDQGPWSGDPLRREVQESGPEAGARLTVKVNEEELQDQLAALEYLRSLAVVDAQRMAIAGCSFGGIQTMLAAEQDLALRAGVNFAGAAYNWDSDDSRPVRERMLAAAENAKIPIFFIQAENDVSTRPTQELAERMREVGKPHQAKIYPAFGTTNAEGHSFCRDGWDIWSEDVFRFLAQNMN